MPVTRRTTLAGLAGLPLIVSHLPRRPEPSPADRLVAAARAQIGETLHYDPAYVSLAYPGGDVPRDRGVCTDVIIRAYRDAFEFDFQSAVHEDMHAAFAAYPALWGLAGPDRNIDHRRVPNLEAFLARRGAELHPSAPAPGDLLTCRLPGNLPHIAILSDRHLPNGALAAIHNIGRGAEESALIGRYARERHFRFFPV